jgi:hypothetical protein
MTANVLGGDPFMFRLNCEKRGVELELGAVGRPVCLYESREISDATSKSPYETWENLRLRCWRCEDIEWRKAVVRLNFGRLLIALEPFLEYSMQSSHAA